MGRDGGTDHGDSGEGTAWKHWSGSSAQSRPRLGMLCRAWDLAQALAAAPTGWRGWGAGEAPLCRSLLTSPVLQVYNPRIRAESQVLRPISKSQAQSRMERAVGSPPGEASTAPKPGELHPSGGSGAAGTGSRPLSPGTCLRLYSEAFYEQRLPPGPAPHVSETSLSRLVLLLKRLDIADMGQCDFLDRPGTAWGWQGPEPWPRPCLQPGLSWGGAGGSCGCRRGMGGLAGAAATDPTAAPESLMQALEDLDYLAALDDDGNLSEVGIIMSEFPLDPQLAKALIASCEFDCVEEMVSLAAMLTGTVREGCNPQGQLWPGQCWGPMVTFPLLRPSLPLLPAACHAHGGGRGHAPPGPAAPRWRPLHPHKRLQRLPAA